ncbi:aldehyde dehydrogenase [Xylogone sp. PMI_703]|nr:aldehyde dehydrogenase [Xylogone sp. PMI_703]
MAQTVEITLPTGKTYSQPTGLFIDNEFIPATSGRTFETINPATGKVICSVQEADENDVDIAVNAARRAFHRNSPWRQTPPAKRGRLLCKLADLMEENAERLALVETLDNGKALKMAKVDVQACADVFRYYGGWADKIVGQTVDTGGDRLGYTLHEPIGVCGQIIPWNFPLLMLTWKIAPAVACGCTVALKTAEQTPLSALIFAELVVKAGFVKGVINIISGFGKVAGAALAAHMQVDKVAFTGSTAVGRSILHAAASSNLKKVTLELGGKSPQVIFDDADLPDAVKWTVEGSFFNHGQNCAAGSRIYVQDGVYNEFVSLFKEQMKKIVIGDPFDSHTYQGPQISQVQFDRIMGYIKSAQDEGGNIEVGGQKFGDEGFFINPTVITNANKDMKVVQEEIFGPVVVISKFHTVEEVIDLGNATQFGLAAGVHSKDFKQSFQVAKGLEAGSIYVNCYNRVNHQMPFGGYKLSGIGRELGSYALENYCEVKSIHVNMGMPAPVFKL